MSTSEIFSVSSYLDRLNSTLKTERAKILGEISGIQMYEGRSYLYFSIKDKKDGSTVKCFMWKNDYKISGVNLEDGLEVVITAYPSIYKPNGGLSMQVELVELVGAGALQLAYEKLKKKLELEGLFSESRKRPLPVYPQKIGVITSKSGAVINDFTTNIGKYGYQISFVDSRVEGQDAIKDLLHAVETLKNKDLDVLVIMRGGGSLESFQAFNNETLARAVADFPVPVITGIGHDKDAPLISLISDKNVSTPTAVANLLNSTWNDALARVRLSEEKIFSRFESALTRFKMAETTLQNGVLQIETSIKRVSEVILIHTKDILREFTQLMTRTEEVLKQSAKSIELSSPERALARGYSIVRSGGKVVRFVKDVKSGDSMEVMVSDGTINTKII